MAVVHEGTHWFDGSLAMSGRPSGISSSLRHICALIAPIYLSSNTIGREREKWQNSFFLRRGIVSWFRLLRIGCKIQVSGHSSLVGENYRDIDTTIFIFITTKFI